MTLFDWMDRHWFVAGWCSIILCAGLASVLHGIGKRIRAGASGGQVGEGN